MYAFHVWSSNIGSGDIVFCFHCGQGLRDWDPSDDPWEEHAKWSPKCAFVTNVKGREYANVVKSNQTRRQESVCLTSKKSYWNSMAM